MAQTTTPGFPERLFLPVRSARTPTKHHVPSDARIPPRNGPEIKRGVHVYRNLVFDCEYGFATLLWSFVRTAYVRVGT